MYSKFETKCLLGTLFVLIMLMQFISMISFNGGAWTTFQDDIYMAHLLQLNVTLSKLKNDLHVLATEAAIARKYQITALDQAIVSRVDMATEFKSLETPDENDTFKSKLPVFKHPSSASNSEIGISKSILDKKALLFTMDSMSNYEENSKRGGASGEIIIRNSLERAFKTLNVALKILRSDQEFESINAEDYNFIILDPWY